MLSVKRTVLAIAWLAINQSVSSINITQAVILIWAKLSSSEASARQRPERFWSGSDLGKLTLVRRRAEQSMRVGDRVLLKNQDDVPVTTHGKEGVQQGPVEVRTLVVRQTRSTVNVLWQDGTKERLDSRETVPYLNPDEYDCW